MKTMKEIFADTIRTTVTGIILLISWAELEAILKVLIALLIALYWAVRIYKMLKHK